MLFENSCALHGNHPSAQRVFSITIRGSTCKGTIPDINIWVTALWRVLDVCTATTEKGHGIIPKRDVIQNSNNSNNSNTDLPAGLMILNIRFDDDVSFALMDTDSPQHQRVMVSILEPLVTTYATLTRGLLVLRLSVSIFDETPFIGPLATLAKHLQELLLCNYGLTSVRGLVDGCCERLKIIDLTHCKLLESLDGLQNRLFLEHVIVAGTAIASLHELQNCPSLRVVDAEGCRKLSSLQGLEHHEWLFEVDVSNARITSVCELQSCPVLKKVNIRGCQHITSLDGLQNHALLEEIDASYTAISTLEELLTCPALTTISLYFCQHLSTIDGLGHDHQQLQEVDVSFSAVESVRPLKACTALKRVYLTGCKLRTAQPEMDLPEDVAIDPSW